MSGESKPNDWPSSKFRPKKSRLKWAAFFWRCIGDNFLSSRETAPETKYVIFQGANIAPRFRRARWAAWVEQGSAEMRDVLATSVRRMGWMRHLPTNRKLGRDLQRVRAAYDLLA